MRRLAAAAYSLVGALGVSLVLLPSEALAACNQWEMPTNTIITQSNGTSMRFETSPSEGGFVGKAEYGSYNPENGILVGEGKSSTVHGYLEGSVEGPNVHFTIHWSKDFAKGVENATGVYSGTIGPQGRLTGTAYKAENPRETATWWATEVLICRVAAAPPPASRAIPLGRVSPPVALGRKQVRPPVSLGRKQVVTPLAEAPPGALRPPICESARSARARGSPAADGLERQCQAAGGPLPPEQLAAPVPEPDIEVEEASGPNAPTVQSPICEAASEARKSGVPNERLDALCRGGSDVWGQPGSDTGLGSQQSSSAQVRYRAVLRITSDTCPFTDYATTSRADIEASVGASRFTLPLLHFDSIFDRYVTFGNAGGNLSYDGLTRITAGVMPADSRARFHGTVAADFSTFDLRFDVYGPCTISGTVTGSRIES